MTSTSKETPIVTIIGGSGFVGRYIAQALAKRGWRIRVACRRPNEALFTKPYGAVGQVEPVQCNIRNEASVAQVIAGSDAVVNCVGVLFESGQNTFEGVQAEGAGRIARLAAEAGVSRFVHVSAIGADGESAAEYARTKAEGEQAVLESFGDAVILRPSIIFGTEDQFFNRFAAMTRMSPILPMIGAETKFQPVWVQDVAEAAARAVEGKVAPGIYELGGPNVYSFRELMTLMLDVVKRRRLLVNIPFSFARLKASFLQMLPNPPLTVDQVRMLEQDNVVQEGAQGFAEIGIVPTAPEAVIESYLYAYRPYGQYTALTESGDAA